MTQWKWKPSATAAVKCVVSAVLLASLLRSLPDGIDWQKFRSVNLGWLGVGLVAGVAQYALLALRWRLTTLAWLGAPMPAFDSSRFNFLSMLWISAAISQILPGLVAGDGYRIAALRSSGLSLKTATASVVSDRLIGMTALVLLALPGVILLLPIWPMRWFLPFIAAAGLLAWSLRYKLLAGLRLAPVRVLQFGRLLHNRFVSRQGAVLLVLAVIGHLISVMILVCLVRSLSLGVPLIPLALLFPLALFAAMVPVSAGGWGVRELTLVSALVPFGASGADVLLASVFFGILNIGLAAGSALFIVASLFKAKDSFS